MPRCTKCNHEYHEEIRICTDCGGELIEVLKKSNEMELLFTAATRDIAVRFLHYLDTFNIIEYELREKEHDENKHIDIDIYLPPDKIPKASKLLEDFQNNFGNNEFKKHELDDVLVDLRDSSDDEPELSPELESEYGKNQLKELISKKSTIYVKKSDRYNDLKFSAFSFFTFSVTGFILVLINFITGMRFLSSFTIMAMSIVFIIFLIIGITTLKKSNAIKSEISDEEDNTNKVSLWMTEHFTDDYYKSLHDDNIALENQYFEVMETLLGQITEAFPTIDTDYLEQLVDENYGIYLEK